MLNQCFLALCNYVDKLLTWMLCDSCASVCDTLSHHCYMPLTICVWWIFAAFTNGSLIWCYTCWLREWCNCHMHLLVKNSNKCWKMKLFITNTANQFCVCDQTKYLIVSDVSFTSVKVPYAPLWFGLSWSVCQSLLPFTVPAQGVMHVSMLYVSIQDQGYGGPKVAKITHIKIRSPPVSM